MLTLTNASLGYRDKTVLHEISFSLGNQEIIGLVAPNGFGKTTLLSTLAGNISFLKKGSLQVDETSPSKAEAYARHVYFAPSDNRLLNPRMSGLYHLESIKYLWNSHFSVEFIVKETDIQDFVGLPVKKYSQGMARQLALAMARMSAAPYILLDEPINALDPIKAQKAAELIQSMSANGASILISSHIPEALDIACTNFTIIKDKKLKLIGKDLSCRELFYTYYG